jgi:CDP-paratose 2-epimerase
MTTIAITGICGFVASELALQLRERFDDAVITGIDNFSRPGSETTRPRLVAAGITVHHGDVRCASDVDALGDADWLIDAAAHPSVLAGVDGRSTSRQVIEHNLGGTVNVLEYCKARGAGVVLLSSSRVHSIAALRALPLITAGDAFAPDPSAPWPPGASPAGLSEEFPTSGPISLYGATKLASEALAIEYGDAFGLPVVINRCGVLAGGGQFGTAEQGIFSYWLRAWGSGLPLAYLGFDGTGHQVRDALHPADLADLVERQLRTGPAAGGTWSVGGGPSNAMSLAQLSAWCADRFGPRQVRAEPVARKWDVPWVVIDAQRARRRFEWTVSISIADILTEIADHHRRHPDWLTMSRPL